MPTAYIPKNLPPNVNWLDQENETGLIHTIHLPDEASLRNPAPVVIMVHGWAGNETATWPFAQTIPENVAIIAPRAPLHLEAESYIWFEYGPERLKPEPTLFQNAIAKLAYFIQRLPDLYPINPDHLILLGFSQGAMMVNAFTLVHPKQVSGVVSLAGLIAEPPNFQPNPNFLADLPVFIAHGIQDKTVPLNYAQQARQTYTDLGAKVTYGEYAVGHKMNREGLKDLKAWMASTV